MVEFRVVRFVLLEREIAVANLWELPGTDRIERALNKQRLDVSSGPTDSGGFLLLGTLVVLRRKLSPGAKVL